MLYHSRRSQKPAPPPGGTRPLCSSVRRSGLGLSKVSSCQVITTKARAAPKPRKVTSEPIITTHTARGHFLLPDSLFLLPGKTGLTQPQTATQDDRVQCEGGLWTGSQVTWLPALALPLLLVWSYVVSCSITKGTVPAHLPFMVVTGERNFDRLECLVKTLQIKGIVCLSELPRVPQTSRLLCRYSLTLM